MDMNEHTHARHSHWLAPLTLFIVALTAIPFGSKQVAAWTIAAIIIFALWLYQLSVDLRDRTSLITQLRRLGAAPWMMLAALLWMAYQASGLPPQSLHHPIFQELPAHLNSRSAISIDPTFSQFYLLRNISYVAVFWIMYRNVRTSDQARRLLTFVCGLFCLFALYTIWTYVTGRYQTTILWFPHSWSGTAPSGTFTNQNHFGAYLVIGATLAYGLILSSIPRRRRDIKRLSIRERLNLFFADLAIGRAVAGAACLSLIVPTIFLTNSNGAIAGFLGSFLFLTTLHRSTRLQTLKTVWRRIGHQSLLTLTLATAGLLTVGLILFLSPAVQSLLAQYDPMRAALNSAALDAIGNNFWLGTGAGTYTDAFSQYKTAASAQFNITSAHNSFLQQALELGVPATILFFVSLATLCALCLKGIAIRKNSKWLPMTGATLLSFATLHALIDFGFEVPAVALMFAALLGLITAQALPSERRKHR